MKSFTLLLLLVLCISCDQKKITEVDPKNVREDLLRYGDLNPENEVLIETGFGNMRIRLYEDTPLHRANFIKNIKEGVYEDGEFYRIHFQFMIQAGIYPDELNYDVPAEFNKEYIHKTGALSMARSDENNPDLQSSSTEFFIVHGSKYTDYQVDQELEDLGLTLTPAQKETYMASGGYMSLDQQYTTFGEVVEGLDVIEKIASVKVHNEDKPLKKIPMKISVISSK
jgi:Peptidyl-prolyl cis-trans isomerase (rotamase) - cyclophilin family